MFNPKGKSFGKILTVSSFTVQMEWNLLLDLIQGFEIKKPLKSRCLGGLFKGVPNRLNLKDPLAKTTFNKRRLKFH
jgi:hypothetical protein